MSDSPEIAALKAIGFQPVACNVEELAIQRQHPHADVFGRYLAKMVLAEPHKRSAQTPKNEFTQAQCIQSLNSIYSCACGNIKFGQRQKAVQHIMNRHLPQAAAAAAAVAAAASSVSPSSRASPYAFGPSVAVDDPKNACARCQSTSHIVGECARCKRVAYCSTECQKLDWSTHRVVCIQASTAPSKVKAETNDADDTADETEADDTMNRMGPSLPSTPNPAATVGAAVTPITKTPRVGVRKKAELIEQLATLSAQVRALETQLADQKAETNVWKMQVARLQPSSEEKKENEEGDTDSIAVWQRLFGTSNPLEAVRWQAERIAASASEAREQLCDELQARMQDVFTSRKRPREEPQP
jgi:hypothetical protein